MPASVFYVPSKGDGIEKASWRTLIKNECSLLETGCEIEEAGSFKQKNTLAL